MEPSPLSSMDGVPTEAATRSGSVETALAARGITKHFPGVLANDCVDFDVRPGEVHALLGENGSGKTTLCKIFTGLYRADAGEVIIDDEPVDLRSPADAHAAGVFMVHQHFSLVDRMSVAENVVLGWSRNRSLLFDRGAVEEEVAEAARRFDVPVDPRKQVWQLSIGERQRVEILKALCRGARTLILDEPTTVLTPQEVERLFAALRRMAAAGSSVVFISHKLHEVLAVCDRVTVLRRGRTTGTMDLGSDRPEKRETRELARMMVGREIEFGRRTRSKLPDASEPVLQVRDVVVNNDFGRATVNGISFDVPAGEVLGVAGVAGNGQRELAEAIGGLRPRVGGDVLVGGRSLRSGSPRAAIAEGVAFVPEDRMGTGLAAGLTVSENLLLKAFRTRVFSAGPFVRGKRVLEHAAELLKSFDVRGNPDSLVRQLSGGNAQKVLLAREMSSSPRVLIIAAPTRGLDVAATETVRRLLGDAADAGVAVVMISEDLDEVLDLADRVMVMCDGRVTGVLDAEGADVEEIGLMMMGQAATA